MIERNAATPTHGRYLVEPASRPDPAPVLVGFHGYAEAAETQLERMRAIPGADRWLLVSIQGLHRFYRRRSSEVIASWMTRQDRELAIDDNLVYVGRVLDEVTSGWSTSPTLVFAGFSQGVATAFRAAVHSARAVSGIIAVGGDIPPEIAPARLGCVTTALVCHGTTDNWYTSEKFAHDRQRLRDARVDVRAVEFAGGHEWSSAVVDAAAEYLRERPS